MPGRRAGPADLVLALPASECQLYRCSRTVQVRRRFGPSRTGGSPVRASAQSPDGSRHGGRGEQLANLRPRGGREAPARTPPARSRKRPRSRPAQPTGLAAPRDART